VGEVVEPRRCREKSFCCGGGGGHMWMEEKAPRVNSNRTAELLATGADQVAVACPFCTIMIEDGLKEANQEDRVKVLELSEVLARSLPAPN
jgi:Fe-S oxidoreductase